MKGCFNMNKNRFIHDLSLLLEEYKLDKFTKFNSVKLATCIFWLLYTLYDFPKKEVR